MLWSPCVSPAICDPLTGFRGTCEGNLRMAKGEIQWSAERK